MNALKRWMAPLFAPPLAALTKRGGFVALSVAVSFFGLLALIGWLAARQAVTPQMAMLMGVALLGLYVGFGILIAAYRLINKLD